MKRVLHIVLAMLIVGLPVFASAQEGETAPEGAAVGEAAKAPELTPPPMPVTPVEPAAEEETVEAPPVVEPPAEAQELPMAPPVEPVQVREMTEEEKSDALKTFEKMVHFNATLQTVLVYQNDYDYDNTPPAYNPDGQSVGLLGTFFKPRFRLVPIEEVEIVYEAELGLNLWGRNDPDQYLGGETDTFLLAHRELYARGEFMNRLIGFKVGYQYFTDPTELFIGHWIGAMSLTSSREWADFTLSVGQLPDQTAEGVTLDENNFKQDTFVYGMRVDVPIDNWMIMMGLYGLNDSQVVNQTLNLFTPSLRVSADYDWVQFGLDLAFQTGSTERGAAFDDERTTAWALQAFADFKIGNLFIEFNDLFLSGDDDVDRNKTNNAFYYSGKSRSRTLILSEDHIRDRGDNLDERLADRRGKFYLVRPGYSLTDLTIGYDVSGFFVPAVTVGAGFGINKTNALNANLVGIETDLDLEFKYKDVVSFHLIGAILAPGGVAAAYVNSYDRTAIELQYMFESSLSVTF